ncbi:hypothetical protein TNCV_370841 [Trichonephila clavipes]|nr:hypothetical protein TNCV_370841 [Trichonephila clavipes]
MPTWPYNQDFTKFPLNHHYNLCCHYHQALSRVDFCEPLLTGSLLDKRNMPVSFKVWAHPLRKIHQYEKISTPSALIHPSDRHPFWHGLRAEQRDLASSQAKPMEVYSQNAIFGGLAKVDDSLGSLQVSQDRTYSGHRLPWLSKSLGFLGQDSTFVNVCGCNALCSSESQGVFRSSQQYNRKKSFRPSLYLTFHPSLS